QATSQSEVIPYRAVEHIAADRPAQPRRRVACVPFGDAETGPPGRPWSACGPEIRGSACDGGCLAETCASCSVNPLKRKRRVYGSLATPSNLGGEGTALNLTSRKRIPNRGNIGPK